MKEIFLLTLIFGIPDFELSRYPSKFLPPDPTFSSSVIDLSDTPPFVKLPQVLREAGGIISRDFSGNGAFSNFSLRGGSPEDTVLFLEGIPLYDFRWGTGEGNSFPLWMLERVEVYKTSIPSSMPLGNMNGAVNLNLKKNEGGLSLNIYGGSFSSGGGNITGGYGKEKWAFTLGAGYEYTEGNFSFHNDNGTPFNPQDDFEDRRKNNGREDVSSYIVFSKSFRKFELSSLFLYSHERTGIPGFYSHQTERATFNSQYLILGSKVNFLNSPSPSLSIFAKGKMSRFYDPLSEVGLLQQDERSALFETGFDLLFPLNFSGEEFLLYGGAINSNDKGKDEFTGGNFHFNLLQLHTGVEWNKRLKGARISLRLRDEFYLLRGKNSLLYSFPQEIHLQNFLSPSAGITLILSPHFILFLNCGLNFKPPLISQITGDRGFIVGNPSLPPEKSAGAEAGLRFVKGEHFFAEGVFFSSYLTDARIFIQNSQYTVKPQAVGRALKTGFEMNFRARYYFLSGNFTFTGLYSRDLGEVGYWRGKILPGQPFFYGSFNLSGKYKFAEISYRIDFEGEKYLDRANACKVGPYHIHSLILYIFIWKNELIAGVSLNNIFDTRPYDYYGFPLPGRGLFFTMRMNFKKT